MAKVARVLIPTDFSVDSLCIILDFLESNTAQPVELILACGYDLGDSITGLLGFTKEDHLAKLESEDFIKGCEMIKARFKSTIVEMYSDLIISKNSRYLRNYFKGNRITHILLADGYEFNCAVRGVFDITAVLEKNKDTIGSTVIPMAFRGSAVDALDTMDNIFFRKDWRVSYE